MGIARKSERRGGSVLLSSSFPLPSLLFPSLPLNAAGGWGSSVNFPSGSGWDMCIQREFCYNLMSGVLLAVMIFVVFNFCSI